MLAAHDGHVQRRPGTASMTPMGLLPTDRLGSDHVAIGTTTGTGRTLSTSADFYAGELFADLEPPRPGTLDAITSASHDVRPSNG
ncbi:erythromycin esterase [Saccharothrix australiensis]|uniref:Erythromycin esterase n=1 Tax=Saccharothrix australiensis TaxID=2072 RepID=A0A495W3R5_9PSEU|nr:erythromycin esterase [Saccharothrix australiensis]